ncbi:hypothetical protein [Kribbella rubisoli]|uniref:hypothetical protein n=1 Tax=Kribbella rubisoli TaxID=3075929 RepID=UPI0013005542|nr:hypothetical protein [Kribbella rubisoli]
MSALRADLPRAEMAGFAGAVAAAAAEFNAEAYGNLRTASGDEREELDRLTDLTESLSELWSDMHAAYLGQQPS